MAKPTPLTAVLADSLLTYAGLRWLGTAEGSPAVADMIRLLGLGPGLAVRTVLAGLAVAAVVRVPDRSLAAFALTVLWMVNSGVVWWNADVMWG